MFRYALHYLRITALECFFNEPGTSDVRTSCPPEALLGPDCPIPDTSSSTIANFLEHTPFTPWKTEWTSTTQHRYCLEVITDGLWPMIIQRCNIGQEMNPIADNPADEEMLACKSLLCKFELAPGCQIPTKLLRGPWSLSKTDFLRMLINAGATLDWETSNNGEIADKALREAIVQGNADVVRLLTQEWSKVTPEQRTTFPYIRGTRCARCPIRLTIDHLRLAVMEGGCKEDVVSAVVAVAHFENKRVLGADEAIENWAAVKKAQGDPRGKWLLDYLEGLPECVRWVPLRWCGLSY
ncbi:MAG: hypothetical protein Q9174_004723 [Haloplaca sp. 1 TL-2023]